MQGDRQCPGVAEPLGTCKLAALGHKILQQQRSLLLLLLRWVFVPSLLAAARPVLGCGSCPSAQRAPLSRKQVAVALTLLDFDRLGGESFRVCWGSFPNEALLIYLSQLSPG